MLSKEYPKSESKTATLECIFVISIGGSITSIRHF